jgi:hypothetical protein
VVTSRGAATADQVTGTPRVLPAEHEVALLRAGQEALAPPVAARPVTHVRGRPHRR